jgi:hypothetical protein
MFVLFEVMINSPPFNNKDADRIGIFTERPRAFVCEFGINLIGLFIEFNRTFRSIGSSGRVNVIEN